MAEALIFRRGFWRRSLIWMIVAGGWVTSAALGLWFLALVIEPGWSAAKVMNSATVLAMVCGLVPGVLLLQRWNRGFAHNCLTIDDAGVRGRLGEREVLLSWPEILGVCRARTGNNIVYTLATDRGWVAFSAIEIPRPRRAARAIAERIGRPIEEVRRR